MNRNECCKTAFAQTDITPDFPTEMIGCHRADNRPDGVHAPLLAQVLLFEKRQTRYCLIVIDSLGLTTELSDELRAAVADTLRTAPSHVMLNFSHTHSAPAPKSPLGGARYFALLLERVNAAAKRAFGTLQPCLAAWSLGKTDIAENRRDGCDTVDRRLGALQLVYADSKIPIAVLLRISAHANTLMAHSTKLSSDFFGPAREMLSAHFGCPVMLIQGAAGNLKPVGVDKLSGGTPQDTERIARLLLESARGMTFQPQEVRRLAMYEQSVEVLSDVPSEAQAKRIVEESGLDGQNWLAECARLRAKGITRQTNKTGIHFFFINEGCLCGVPDEIFCELSLETAAKANTPLLFFNGYTNGCTGYLPHRAEWLKGGYETLYSYLHYYPFHGHVMPFAVDTADKLTETVLQIWKKHKV